MKKQNKNDNAANRKSYVGEIYNIGEKQIKKNEFRFLENRNGQISTEKDIFIFTI